MNRQWRQAIKRPRARAALIVVGLVAAAAVVIPAIGGSPKSPADQPSAQQKAIQDLQRSAGGRLVVHTTPDGVVSFVGATTAHPVPRAQGVAPGAGNEASARAFVDRYGTALGVDDPATDLQVEPKPGPSQSVKFQQHHDGVPVLGAEIAVRLDTKGNVLSSAGETSPALDVDVTPTVSGTQAEAQARARMAKAHAGTSGDLRQEPALWIYDPKIMGGPDTGPARLVWQVELAADSPDPFRDVILVDAHTGTIALDMPSLAEGKVRNVCNFNNVVKSSETCTAPYARADGQAPTGVADIDNAYDFAGITYDFYKNMFGRDSLNNAGLVLNSTVKYCPDSSHCPYQNAYWNGTQMTYGDGFASADDVVGHELTHGVTEFESHLFYYYQSGAINESLSDVFGEFIDQTDGVGNDSPAVKWQVGEDLPASIGVIRNMADPTIYSDPDRMQSSLYYAGTADSGGVHTNSGVNNKAAFLMTDGGTFNGYTITGLGIPKAAHIYYEAQTNLLTSASDYQDLGNDLQQACTNLVGSYGITTADCGEVAKVVAATQMLLQPTVAGASAPEAPVCGAGTVPHDLFNDNLENPASGNWAKTNISGTQTWAYPQNPNVFSGFDGSYATSGTTNMFGGDITTTSNNAIGRTANVTPPVGKTTYLRFAHAYDLEKNYDGGRVEYSTNNGSTWTDAGSLFTDNGYNGTASAIGGSAFNNVSNGYTSSRVDLTSLAGQNVRFRFRLATDSSVGNYGWWIDDVRVYTCDPAPTAPGAPTIGTATAGDTQATVTWTAPASDGGSAITGYQVTPYIGSSPQTAQVFNSTAVSQQVTGLANGTTYTFKVAAINAIGTGTDSAASNAVTPVGLPGAPTIGTATAGNGTAHVTWTAPSADGGTAISGYTVTPYLSGVAQAPQPFASTATEQDIAGLTNGSSYTFTVAATNAVGTGPASDQSNAVVPQGGVPAAPTIGTATAGNASATLTWTAPTDDGGSPVTGYAVTPYIGTDPQPMQTFDDTGTSHQVTGLTNGTTYTFTVSAINANGQGQPSEQSNTVTPSGTTAPDAPTIGTALPGNGTATVKWNAPASNGGSPITGYLVTPYIGSVPQPTVVFNSTATTQTLNGLTNGTTYTFTVQAENAIGTGAASGMSNPVTAGTPGAPGFQAAVPGNTTARVAFTTPPNYGSPITGYQITPYLGTTALTTQVFNNTATSQIVTGLTNGTTYSFAVQAINGNGAGATAVTAPITVGTPASPAFPNPVPAGNDGVRISWLAAASNGSPITSYTVTPYIGSTAQAPITFNDTGTLHNLTGLTSGTTYTFRVYATNGVGAGTASISPAVTIAAPAPPGFQSAAPGDGTAKVQYIIPPANGSPITGYLVTPVIGSTPQPTQTFNTPAANQLTVTGLANGTTYSFRVQAVNAIGASPNAVTQAIVVGAPASPAFPTAQPGDSTAKISFFASPDNGSAITGYTVTPYIGSAAQPAQTFPAGSTSLTVTGLTNGTTYRFKVFATNARGSSPVGTTPTAVKVGTPTTPAFPSAQTGNASAKVSWVGSSPNASPITAYVITPVQGTTVLPAQTFNSTATSQVVTGLTNGATYTFRVAAINGIGTSTYSTTAAVKIGQPAAPTGITATTGPAQATVSWTAGSDNGSPITGYVVTPIKAGVAQATRTFNSTATTQIITGLTTGSSYTFKVQAINANGTGLTSTASNAVVIT